MTLATVTVNHDRLRLPLPQRLWADGLRIGERLIAESPSGETIPGVVAVGDDLAPQLVLATSLDAWTARVTVRRPVTP